MNLDQYFNDDEEEEEDCNAHDFHQPSFTQKQKSLDIFQR